MFGDIFNNVAGKRKFSKAFEFVLCTETPSLWEFFISFYSLCATGAEVINKIYMLIFPIILVKNKIEPTHIPTKNVMTQLH